MRFVYPYTVRQSNDGAWQVRFPDVPEALTEAETEAEAHALAADALIAALGGLVKLRRDLPVPSTDSGSVVVLPMLQAAKLALGQAMRGSCLSRRRWVIRCARYGGFPRATTSWQWRSASWATS